MKFIITLLVLVGSVASADVYVNGYTRSNGTYVAPHYRTSPNHTTSDNYSNSGNYNPYTGRTGTHHDSDPYGLQPKRVDSYNNDSEYGL